MKKFSLLVLALVIGSTATFGQLKKGGMAITTAIDNGVNIGGAYALSENMRVNAGVGFQSVSPSGGTSGTLFGVNASVWMYAPASENVTAYYGGGLEFVSRSGGASTSDFGLMAVLGAEYWLSPRFAWGGYVSAGFASGDNSAAGAKGSTFGTMGVGSTLTWWFN